jgi:hypothetical protein
MDVPRLCVRVREFALDAALCVAVFVATWFVLEAVAGDGRHHGGDRDPPRVVIPDSAPSAMPPTRSSNCRGADLDVLVRPQHRDGPAGERGNQDGSAGAPPPPAPVLGQPRGPQGHPSLSARAERAIPGRLTGNRSRPLPSGDHRPAGSPRPHADPASPSLGRRRRRPVPATPGVDASGGGCNHRPTCPAPSSARRRDPTNPNGRLSRVAIDLATGMPAALAPGRRFARRCAARPRWPSAERLVAVDVVRAVDAAGNRHQLQPACRRS